MGSGQYERKRKGNEHWDGEIDGCPVVYIKASNSDTVFIVDAERAEEVSRWTWYERHGYAVSKWNREYIRMHHVIKGRVEGMDTDHINRNRADNRASNLRFVPRGVNLRNVGAQPRNMFGLRGVRWVGRENGWQARVGYKGKRLHLGNYSTPEEASAVVELFVKRLEEAEEEAYYRATGRHFSDPGVPIAV